VFENWFAQPAVTSVPGQLFSPIPNRSSFRNPAQSLLVRRNQNKQVVKFFQAGAGDPIIVRFAPAAKSLSVRPEKACSRLEKLLIHFDAKNCRKIIASQSAFKLP
jgi:hypothetical protein